MAAEGNRMDQLIEDINGEMWTREQREEFDNKYKRTFMKTLGNLKDAEKAKLDDVILAGIRTGNSDTMEMIIDPIFDQENLIDWKNRSDLIVKIVDMLMQTASNRDEDPPSFYFRQISAKFLKTLKEHKILGKHAKKLYEIIRISLQTFKRIDSAMHRIASETISMFPWVDNPDFVVETVKLIKVAVNFNPGVPGDSWLAGFSSSAYESMFGYQPGKNVRLQCLDDVVEIFNVCAQRVFQSPQDSTKKTISYKLLISTFTYFLNTNAMCPELVDPMMSKIRKLWEREDYGLQEYATRIITDMAEQEDRQNYVLLEQFLEGQHPTLATKLPKMYKNQPEKFHPLLPRLLDMTENDDWQKLCLLQLFTQVAEKEPEKLPKESIPTIVRMLKDDQVAYTAVGFLDVMALKQPKSVIPFDKQIIDAMDVTDHYAISFALLLAKLCIDEAHQRKYMKVIADAVEKNTNGPEQNGLISTMRTIGLNCPAILGEHRKLIERLRNRVDLRDVCQMAIDVIDGRRREVSLADAIKKPIIPLMLENSSWPPEGPMGMVFTQLLYIDFCKPGEDIQKDWKCPQFDQLLEQISKTLPATSAGEATSRPSETPVKQPAKYPITESKKTEKHETKNGTAAGKPATLLKPSTRPKPESVPKPEAGERKETALKPEVRLKPLTLGKPAAPLKPAKPGKSSSK